MKFKDWKFWAEFALGVILLVILLNIVARLVAGRWSL